MKNEKIIFVTGLFPKEFEQEITVNTIKNLQNAANNLQWNFVKGFEKNDVEDFKIINSLYIGAYPDKYKKMLIPSFKFQTEKFSNHVNTSFINLPLIKQYLRYKNVKKALKKEIEGNDNGFVIAYAMTTPFVKVLKYVKKSNRNIKTCLIVPDLPLFMDLANDRKKLFKILKNIDNNFLMKDLEYIDSFVFLTDYMATYLNCKKPYTVIEGVYTETCLQPRFSNHKSENSVKRVLYTGTLHEKYGVKKLVDSFISLPNKDIELVICGEGEMAEYIKEIAKKDSRVIFKGLVSRNDVLILQQESALLINPRENNEEYTKYSFPSKNLEYMSSGTPLLCYKLDGIEDEYYPYLYLVDDYENLFRALQNILAEPMDSLVKKGTEAKKFVEQEKNAKKQVGKLLDMFKKM